MNTKGVVIATAVAGLFATMVAPAIVTAQTQGIVRCEGVNSCKGKSDCKSAKNACAGKNGCKGQGYVRMTEKACNEIGGTSLPLRKEEEKKP